MRIAAILSAVLLAILVAGCGGDDSPETAPLREGVYEFELTREYLVENGIGTAQADNESGRHEVTLADGAFVDRWRTEAGTTGACSGTYEEDGNRLTFRWKSGCFGDWAMSYAVDGDSVQWSEIEALPPYDDEEEQNVTEVFNGVPWQWAGAAPAS